MNTPYIPPKSENENIANRLIEMNVFDCSEEDELKDTQIYFLQNWLINALDERIDFLSKRLQEESQKDVSWKRNLIQQSRNCLKCFSTRRQSMRSAESYQSIRTPEEEYEERSYESIYQSLLNEFDPDEGDFKAYQNWCRKRARELASERCREEEEDERE